MKFLVGLSYENFEDGNFQVVEAANINEAKAKFAEDEALNENSYFEEYLSSKSAYEGFSSQFWQEPLPDQKVFLGVGQIIDREQFEKKIRKFFANYPGYAEVYLNEYFSDEDYLNTEFFPNEMKSLIYVSAEYEQLTVFELEKLSQKPGNRR